VEKSKVTEILPIITGSLLALEQAKADCKVMIDSACETYELSPNEMRAIIQVAKKKIAAKLDDFEAETDVLAEMIGIAQETGTQA